MALCPVMKFEDRALMEVADRAMVECGDGALMALAEFVSGRSLGYMRDIIFVLYPLRYEQHAPWQCGTRIAVGLVCLERCDP